MATPKNTWPVPRDLTLKTPRLFIRTPREDDDPHTLALFNKATALSYLPFLHKNGTWTLEEIRKRREGQLKRQFEDLDCLWLNMFLLPEYGAEGEGNYVGCAGYREITQETGGEFGLVLVPEVWRCGMGSEAHLYIIDYAFDVLKLSRVCFRTGVDNAPMRKFYDSVGIRQCEMKKVLVDPTWVAAEYEILVDDWPRVRESLERKVENALKNGRS